LKLRCTICNYIYDEDKEGIKFSALHENWVCPVCGAPKSAFEPLIGGVAGEKEVT
jgi:pyruvate oxidase